MVPYACTNCLAILAALSRVVCTLLELGPCSSQLALHVQMHELRMCPMLVLNSYLRSQDPMSCMQRKCKASKMPGAGLCNSPCACSGGGSTGLRLCNSESLCFSGSALGFAFRGITNAPRRVQYVLQLGLLSIYLVLMSRRSSPTRTPFDYRQAPSYSA